MIVDTRDLNSNVAVHERFQIEGTTRAHNVMSNGLVFFLTLLKFYIIVCRLIS